jgi:hypothetical protein
MACHYLLCVNGFGILDGFDLILLQQIVLTGQPRDSIDANHMCQYIGVPGGEVIILGGHNIGQCKQKIMYVHVFYSERFPRYSYLAVQFQNY